MIRVTLTGGMGNQMFQYATGRRLADHLGTGLTLDISGYVNPKPHLTPRHYELSAFAIRAELDDRDHFSRRLLTRLQETMPIPARGIRTQLREQSFSFDPRVLSAPDGTVLHGYWQSELYFSDIRARIVDDFQFIEPPDAVNQAMAARIHDVTAVSLHVRRGDYVTNQRHGTKPLDYYSAALEIMSAKIDEPHFFVFSDDPSWCKQNLRIEHPTTYIDHNNADTGYKDLGLMSQCRHHIIANSSFSWWGAWLNRYPDKIVVAPERWFADASIDTGDLYPPEWLKA
jgi:hypothetical protein